ncbi:lipopolysaccharide biosynthesis protein [Rhizobium lentis]|uniref:Lipopolysaccharide biosynthesis protein n=1 Tax=Rhizobium lentis TaxID=1138194 RepID=A0A9Q3R058_9HYPH|nr:lipopolysaccharide biosynthesis protein [Rhizobium lentis]MBX4959175.1 lipopolysaccharide biosynthesis protein [Rhizobium lentis]MBX4989181.1 lipopolysaccharide biosynthesis protein [Rhizobium lentis]MBX5001081.1 lipopolysaccharide biosynthesis protein [Rhizobium lentis]MBX5007725.1 lipopolysaccharide biosynthesis protein [Rhizobium lentis]MBX5013524.1 lipopolysaccharide biosynthesis protein [Rhizobium lentis]
MSSVSQRTATASIWTISGKFLARLIDFVSLLILARLLSPADFGLVAIATSVLVIVEAILDLPLTQALMRQPSPSGEMFSTAFTLSLLRGLAISLLMMIMSWPMAAIYNDSRLFALVAVLSIAPAMRSMISPRMVLFMQRFDFKREFALDLITKGSTLLFGTGVALATGSYWGLAIGAVAGPTAAMITSYILAPMRPRFSLSEWQRFQDMISWNTVSQVLSAINWQLDRLLLPRFTGLPTFGAFSVADNIAGIPYQTFVGPLLRPLMAAFSTVEDRRNLVAAYLKATSAITFVAAPVLIALAFLAEPTVRILVGEKWAAAAPILQWLCLVSLLGLPTNIVPALAMVMDNTRSLALRMFAEFAVRVPVTILGIAYFQVAGALGARVVAVLVAYAASLVITRRLIGASFAAQLSAFCRPLSAGLPMIAFLLWVEPKLAIMPAGFNLIGSLALCGAAAAAIFWVFALLLWQILGRPDGIETIVVQRLMPRRNRLLIS